MASNLGSGYGGSTAVSSSHSASISIPAGTTLLFVLGIRTILDANSPAAPTTATVNGLSMTAVSQLPVADQNTEWISGFYYLNPPTGSQTVVVSGGGGVALDTGFEWSAYDGLGAIDSSSLTNQATTAALALTTTVVSGNSWVIGGYGSQTTSSSITNGSERISATPNNAAGIVDSNGPVPSGSYTITVNNGSELMNGLVASFAEIGGAKPSTLLLMGVG